MEDADAAEKKVVEKAETLSCQEDSRIPVFTKSDGRGSEWTYRGVYEFKELIDDAYALARAGRKSDRTELTYLLRLRRIDQSLRCHLSGR